MEYFVCLRVRNSSTKIIFYAFWLEKIPKNGKLSFSIYHCKKYYFSFSILCSLKLLLLILNSPIPKLNVSYSRFTIAARNSFSFSTISSENSVLLILNYPFKNKISYFSLSIHLSQCKVIIILDSLFSK